jgi:hypothetical protein
MLRIISIGKEYNAIVVKLIDKVLGLFSLVWKKSNYRKKCPNLKSKKRKNLSGLAVKSISNNLIHKKIVTIDMKLYKLMKKTKK